ncbi:hypothetical protein GCM10023175_19970 [Pseudonocardia xishanensis]|uniref:Uncharacterized protein n=1 Tax=Pseudonocardia xishanensis TaxID=630995 RepID=A0ABP8RN39_9PSEU
MSASAPARSSSSWAYPLRSTARRVISPSRRNGREKASALDPAMIVLSRSKKAAAPCGRSVGAVGTGGACQTPGGPRTWDGLRQGGLAEAVGRFSPGGSD